MRARLESRIDRHLIEHESAGLRRRCPTISGRAGAHYRIDGRPVVGFCSNDYLGLAADPLAARDLPAAGAGASRLVCGDLVFDRVSRRVLVDNHELNLTSKAVTLLEYMMTHPDELITRERLLDAVWGWDYPVGTRAVDTRIAELRKLLQDNVDDPRYIETVPGQGYRFVSDVKAGS